MNAYTVRDQLLLGLQYVVLDNGEKLESFLNQDQMKDIANTLTHFSPKGIQTNMLNLHNEMFTQIKGKAMTSRLINSEVVTEDDNVKTLKHKLFVILYNLFLLGEDLDESCEEMVNFYRTFVIDSLELRNEVNENPVQALTVFFTDTEAVRTEEDGTLVPTTKTIKQFKHLL